MLEQDVCHGDELSGSYLMCSSLYYSFEFVPASLFDMDQRVIVKRELRKSYAILDRIYEFLLFSSHAVDIDKIQCKLGLHSS